MANPEHPKPIRVRICWEDGGTQTIGDFVWMTYEVFCEDDVGVRHRFEDSGELHEHRNGSAEPESAKPQNRR